MSNDFSFERNRYFTGKLLTAQDFIAEQKYLAQKRNLLNRALFGTGIVCGLSVIKADETSLAVEPGLALDADGREVLVGRAVVSKLRSIDGYESLTGGEGMQSAYLCLEYRETPAEPVYSVSRDALAEDTQPPEYNKVHEGYALRLVTKEPSGASTSPAALSESLLWDSLGARITMTAPRYADAGGEFVLETRVNRGAGNRQVSFSCTLDLRYLDCGGSQSAEIKIDLPSGEHSGEACERTVIRARPPASRVAEIRVAGASVTIGGHSESIDVPKSLKINIAENARAALLTEIWDTPLELTGGESRMIYLARLQLIVSPPYVSIEHIENRPFGQMILSAGQSLELLRAAAFTHHAPQAAPAPAAVAAPPAPVAAKTGTVHVNIPHSARKGEVITSEPVPHGLGPGTVFVAAHLVSDGDMLSGPGTVFKCPLNWGVKVNRDDGTFTIAVQAVEECGGTHEFCWRAESAAGQTGGAEPVKLSLRPGIKYISARETVIFDAVLSDGSGWRQGELRWTVKPGDGGQIDDCGVFTAFDKSGIYEIRAQGVVDESIDASAFVVVKA